jgi:hypothetical protein
MMRSPVPPGDARRHQQGRSALWNTLIVSMPRVRLSKQQSLKTPEEGARRSVLQQC